MPSTSKSQQRLFGALHSYQQGELKHPSAKIKSMAGRISPTAVTHFAETPHKGLPNRKRHKHASAPTPAALALVKRAADRARRAALIKTAADVATVLSAADPRFAKVAAGLTPGVPLGAAVAQAFPGLPKQAHDRLSALVVRGTRHALRKRGNDGLGAAPGPMGPTAGMTADSGTMGSMPMPSVPGGGNLSPAMSDPGMLAAPPQTASGGNAMMGGAGGAGGGMTGGGDMMGGNSAMGAMAADAAANGPAASGPAANSPVPAAPQQQPLFSGNQLGF